MDDWIMGACDQVDALVAQDPMSRVACETCCTTGLVMVMGEITTNAIVDYQAIVRETVREIGYDRAKYGFDCNTCGVILSDYGAAHTTAYADLSTLRVTDKKGNDRLGCYTVSSPERVSVSFRPRPLTITVRDASKTYDDTAKHAHL